MTYLGVELSCFSDDPCREDYKVTAGVSSAHVPGHSLVAKVHS